MRLIGSYENKLISQVGTRLNGNDNFTTEVKSKEYVENKKCRRSKKKEANLFLFQGINLAN